MKILDSNIIVYSFQPKYIHLRELVLDPNNYVSIISKVEVLGYHKLSNSMELYFDGVFKILNVVNLNASIVDKAIELRQSKKYSLGDAIIAATALEKNLILQTRNEKDFKGVQNLKVENPV